MRRGQERQSCEFHGSFKTEIGLLPNEQTAQSKLYSKQWESFKARVSITELEKMKFVFLHRLSAK